MQTVKRESPKHRSGEANRDWAGEATRAVAWCLAVAVSLLGGPSEAQQAWSIEDVTTESLSALAAAGRVAVPQTVEAADRPTAESATIQVDLDLIRSAPARLELPTTDGRVLTAELSVFEDRGGGDVLWSGRLLGAHHDSIALTIAGGQLAGWFGEPVGVKYRLSATASGGGLMRDAYPELAAGFSCGFDGSGELHLGRRPASRHLVGTGDRSSHQNHDGLKLLVLYTDSAARVWDNPQYGWGGTQAALRNAADYLMMVFRNGRLPLEPTFEFAKAPAWLDAVQSDPLAIGGAAGFRWGLFSPCGTISEAVDLNGEIQLMRRKVGADHVHVFFVDHLFPQFASGCSTWNSATSLLGSPSIFAHEFGHNLGGLHQPSMDSLSREQRNKQVDQYGAPDWWRYTFAHAWRSDGTGVADGERGAFGTAIGYPSTEPYYSTVRITPQGQQIGIAGERENERAFWTSIYDLAALSLRERIVPLPATNLQAEVGSDSIRLSWTDNSTKETGFEVTLVPHGNANEGTGYDVPRNVESLQVPFSGPGVYTATIQTVGSSGPNPLAGLQPLYSIEHETFVVPGAEPRSPTNVAVAADPGHPDRCRVVTWNERFTGADDDRLGIFRPLIEVQILRGGKLFKRLTVHAGQERLSYCLPEGNGLYEFRVHARTWGGRSRFSEGVKVPVGIEEPVAVPAGDRGATLHWGGRWATAPGGRLRVQGRTPASDGWVELATAAANDASVRIEGLASQTPYTFRLAAGGAGAEEYSELVSLTTGPPVESCRDGAPYLCLQNERFEVRVHWSNPDRSGDFGKGTAVPAGASDESGLFWFFDPDNVELVLKVLDGRAVNGNHWVFFGALSDVEYWVTVDDTASGRRLTYYNPPKTICGQSDTQSFGSASLASGASYSSSLGVDVPGTGLMRLKAAPLDRVGASAEAANSGDCAPGDQRLCLLGGRFAVEVEFVDPNDGTGKVGHVLPALSTGNTGFFWFFSPGNVELAAKVLDGRALNGKFWFLYGGLSDVEFVITVTDTETGEVRSYRNPPGSVCGGIDTQALGQ